MKTRKVIIWPSGFSVLELLIAIVIFSIAGLAFAQMIRGSASILELSGNSFQGFHLGAKVMEHLVEESRINGDILMIFNEFPDLCSRSPVVDSQSPYFRFIFDREAPWGQITPQEGGITAADGSLYTDLRSFHAEVSAKRWGDPNSRSYERHLSKTHITIDWTELNSAARKYEFELLKPSPVGPCATDSVILIPPDRLLQLVREKVFPNLAGRTFDQAVSETGCNYDLAFHIGKVLAFSDTLVASMTAISSEISVLSQKRKGMMRSPPDLDLVDLQLKISRLSELCASLIYYSLTEMSESIIIIDELSDSASLAKIPKQAFIGAVTAFNNNQGKLNKWLKASKSSFEWLLDPGFRSIIPARDKEFARQKTLEAYRLLGALRIITNSDYSGFVEREKNYYSGKNSFIHRQYLFEEKLVANPNILKSIFPNLTSFIYLIENRITHCAELCNELPARYPYTEGG